MSGRKNPISVYGPKGIRTAIEALMNACEGEIDYPLEVTELVGGGAVAAGSYSVTAFSTQHTPGSIGFVLREKDRPGFFYKNRAAALGIKPGPDYAKLQNGETVNGVTPDQVMGKRRPGCSVAYTGDTAPCESVIEAVRGVDVLIHEATYVSKDGSLAKMHSHSTSADAAGVAKECGVRELFLTHISNRYNDASVSLGEAVSIFPDTVVPSDLQLYQVTHSSVRSV
jgi:ribonuclease Z